MKMKIDLEIRNRERLIKKKCEIRVIQKYAPYLCHPASLVGNCCMWETKAASGYMQVNNFNRL